MSQAGIAALKAAAAVDCSSGILRESAALGIEFVAVSDAPEKPKDIPCVESLD